MGPAGNAFPEKSRALRSLRARIDRRFETIDEDLPVGPLRVRFTRVADPEKVLDDLCRRIDAFEKSTGARVAGDALGLPYWAELWDSATGVGQWLLEHRDEWRDGQAAGGKPQAAETSGARVLDLGCGMGLAGTVAALLGARVLLGDIETACLPFARLNATRYGGDRVRVRRIDWQRDDLGLRFDLILGSDVLYDKTQWPHLEPFFRRHLAEGGHVLLGEPGRQTGDLFQPWVRKRGWTLKLHTQPVPTRSTPIRLLELTA